MQLRRGHGLKHGRRPAVVLGRPGQAGYDGAPPPREPSV